MSKKSPLAGNTGNSAPKQQGAAPVSSESDPQSKKQLVLLAAAGIVVFVVIALVTYFMFSGVSGGSKQSPAPQPEASQPQKPQVKPEEGSAQPAITDARALQVIRELRRDAKDDPRSMGSPDAPVVMMEFADFSCPVCMHFDANVLPQLKPFVDDGTLRIEFHNFNIFSARYSSDLAARGAVAAGFQGKFWEFVDASIALNNAENSNHPKWTEERVLTVAKNAGVSDMAKFKEDYASPATIQLVAKETAQAQQAGFGGTPAFLVNNRYISGVPSLKVFEDTIKAAAKDAKQAQN